MAANRFDTPAQREQHLTKVAALYEQGMWQTDIAKQLGCSQPQISYDIRTLREEWYKSRIRDFDAHVARELATIDFVQLEAEQAWFKSKEDKERKELSDTTGDKVSTRKSIKKEGQAGDGRFLEVIIRCSQERRKILGTDAPIKMEHTSIDPHSMTDDQLNRELAGLANLDPRLRAAIFTEFSVVPADPSVERSSIDGDTGTHPAPAAGAVFSPDPGEASQA
jgi:hypothetical protein